MLRAAQADAEKQLPEDDLRVMDTLAFYGAISTFDKNRQAPVDVVLKRYLEYLEKRALLLEYSRPDLDTIRTLPVTTPKPLSQASLPADLRASLIPTIRRKLRLLCPRVLSSRVILILYLLQRRLVWILITMR